MKKVAIAKTIETFKFETNDTLTRDTLVGTLLLEFPDYTYQCDELNNGPAELNQNQLVIDVREGDGIKYTRFIITPNKDVEYHDKP